MPAKTSTPKPSKTSRLTLSEISMNTDDEEELPLNCINDELTLRYTIELHKKLQTNQVEYIKNTLNDDLQYLELVGWSQHGLIPASLYDGLFTNDLKAKKVLFRGRGKWDTCCCPQIKNTSGTLIDTITEKRTTKLEQIMVVRPFKISSCALLDLISRSPNLKTLRFYGVLEHQHHHENFSNVRFLSNLEGVYWPWCDARQHKPTLRMLLKRNDQVINFYAPTDITCDFLNSELLPRLKNLSLIMNEKWVPEGNRLKSLKRYIRNINYLKSAKMVEALELRTFDIETAIAQDTEEEDAKREFIRRNYETYKIQLWENIAELKKLKMLAIHGAWELEEVCREIARHNLKIEFLRTSLSPSSILANIEEDHDNTAKTYVLAMADAARNIEKLSSLKSVHITCHESLINIDQPSVNALKDISLLIWKLDIKCPFSFEVEELMTNILRRGNQNGRSYKIKLSIQPEDETFAKMYTESIEKFSSTTTLKERLSELAQQRLRDRLGRSNFRTFTIVGLEQAGGGRDKETFDQLKSCWAYYDQVFHPADMFI